MEPGTHGSLCQHIPLALPLASCLLLSAARSHGAVLACCMWASNRLRMRHTQKHWRLITAPINNERLTQHAASSRPASLAREDCYELLEGAGHGKHVKVGGATAVKARIHIDGPHDRLKRLCQHILRQGACHADGLAHNCQLIQAQLLALSAGGVAWCTALAEGVQLVQVA